MEALLKAPTPLASPLFQINTTTHSLPSLNPRCLRCSRSNENGSSLFSEASRGGQIRLEGNDVNMLQESLVSTDGGGLNQSDIWKLFNDAQKNILYLNRQRLMAIEELSKAQREKDMLLARIEELEAGKQSIAVEDFVTKHDNRPICWELLLRIDSMVISELVGTREASDLRRVVVENRAFIVDAFPGIRQMEDTELLKELHLFKDRSKRKGLHIVHICTEMAPMVSVGSLASYVTELSRALQRKGNLVEVILPKYSSLNLDEVQGLREIKIEFHSYFNNRWHGNRIWTGVVCGIGVTFIEPLYHPTFFNRDKVYGYSDDFERFSYFSRASLDYIVKSGKQPDVLHIHNWQTAIIGPLFWDIFVNQGLGATRILLTCQDLSSQCLENPDKVALCGLDPLRLHRHDRLQDNTRTDLVNILKGGIVYSNKVVMVSSVDTKDGIVSNMGYGLESTLAIHKDKLLVSPYGLDDTIWDPSKDKFLLAKYSTDDIEGKAICKVALLEHFGFSGKASTVVVGCIYSEVSDVDMENLKAAVLLGLRKGAKFVFMGHSKSDAASESLRELQDENVMLVNKYNEALLHLILAGSDIILCPSFHDPLLQVPLKAIKYGAAPVAASLNDENFRRYSAEHDFRGTNSSHYIKFGFSHMSLSQAVDQVMNDPSRWAGLIMDVMSKDFSWDVECCDIHTAAYMSIKNL